jgi:hypothetical protein
MTISRLVAQFRISPDVVYRHVRFSFSRSIFSAQRHRDARFADFW